MRVDDSSFHPSTFNSSGFCSLPWGIVQIEGSATCTKGLWMSIATRDSDVHLAYWVCTNSSPTQSAVHYARSTDLGATWTVEAVDTPSNYGSGECDMAWFRGGLDLDAAGRPHVAYTVSAPGTGSFCIHALRLGPDDWRRDTVEMSSNAYLICYDADLKIDRRNRAHIAYLYNGFQSRYAVEDDSGWELCDVKGTDTAVGVALALDSIDNPHIATGGLNEQRYNYSSDGGANWLTEVVYRGGWWHSDIALGANDEPLIAHSVGTMTTANIWLASRTGPGTWTDTQVDDSTNNSYRPAVFYDREDGSIHVAYYGGNSLKHSWSTDNGQTWLKENVASAYMNSTCNCPDYAHLDPARFMPFETANPLSGVGVAFDITPSCVAESRPKSLVPYPSLSISPNPTSGPFAINYSIPQSATALSLKLYDATGKLVTTLAAACRLSGHGALGLKPDAAPLAPGIYLVRLTTESGSVTQKLVIEH